MTNLEAGEFVLTRFKHNMFMCYSRRDIDIAQRLQQNFRDYRFPKNMVGRQTDFGPIPERFGRVFRDVTHFTVASDLNEHTKTALRESATQIVLCSPHSAASNYVEKEIRYFASLGRESRIFSVLVGGSPCRWNPETSPDGAFPPALTDYQPEPLAAELRIDRVPKQMRARLYVDSTTQVMAGIFGLSKEDLTQEELLAERRRSRNRAAISVAFGLIAMVATILAVAAVQQRNRAETSRSNYVAEAAMGQAESGSPVIGTLLALDSVPRSSTRVLLGPLSRLFSAPLTSKAVRSLTTLHHLQRLRGIFSAPTNRYQFQSKFKSTEMVTSDHRHLASLSEDGSLSMWSLEELKSKWSQAGPFEYAVISGDQKLVLAVDKIIPLGLSEGNQGLILTKGGEVRFYNLETGTLVGTTEGGYRVGALLSIPETDLFLTKEYNSGDKPAILWSTDGRRLCAFDKNSVDFDNIQFSPGGETFLTQDGSLWRTRGCTKIGNADSDSGVSFLGASTVVRSKGPLILFQRASDGVVLSQRAATVKQGLLSSNRMTLVTLNRHADEDFDRLEIFDTNTGSTAASAELKWSEYTLIASDRTGQKAVVRTEDSAEILDWKSGAKIDLITPGNLMIAEFSQDGSHLIGATEDHFLHVWDTSDGMELVTAYEKCIPFRGEKSEPCDWQWVGLSANKKNMLSRTANEFFVWDLPKPATNFLPISQESRGRKIIGAHFGLDRNSIILVWSDGVVAELDRHFDLKKTLYTLRDTFIASRIDVGRKILAVQTANDTVLAIDLSTGELLRQVKHQFPISQFQVSTDRKAIWLSGGFSAVAWPLTGGNPLWAIARDWRVYAAATDPADPNRIISVTEIGLDVMPVVPPKDVLGQQMSTNYGGPSAGPHGYGKFDRTGQFAFSWPGLPVTMWGLDPVSQISNFRCVENVTDIDVSNAGDFVVTGGENGAVRLYDTRIPYAISLIGRHRTSVSMVEISDDGEDILSVGNDGSVLLLPVRPKDFVLISEIRAGLPPSRRALAKQEQRILEAAEQ